MSKPLPPIERLTEVLEYDPATGLFTSKVKRGSRAMPGCGAGSVKACRRVVIQIDGVEYKAHRLAWLMVHGEAPSGEIDHINRDSTDNRIANLRCVSHQKNLLNRGPNKNNTSGTKGVQWFGRTKKWRASICIGGRELSLGYFKNKEDAIDKRKLAELMYHSPMMFDREE